MLHQLISKIDVFLCKVLLLEQRQIIPVFVSKKDQSIHFTEGYRRHLLKCKLNELNFNFITQTDLTKLGIALGKAIATDFVVTFSKFIITTSEPT